MLIDIANRIDERKIEYSECINIINKLRFNEESTLFAVERDKGLESIIWAYYYINVFIRNMEITNSNLSLRLNSDF